MSTIEVGATLDASDHIENARMNQDKASAIAKQRSERRVGAKNAPQSVNRRVAKPGVRDASRVAMVDRGPQKRWRPAYSLPSFPDPPGYSYCWIARHRRRHGDDANLLSSLRSGWEFEKPENMDDQDLPTETFEGRLSRYGEVIGDDTTVLMKIPTELKLQRDKHYSGLRDRATKAVTRRNPGIPEANPKMPLVEDRNEFSVTTERMRARRPAKRDEGEDE